MHFKIIIPINCSYFFSVLILNPTNGFIIIILFSLRAPDVLILGSLVELILTNVLFRFLSQYKVTTRFQAFILVQRSMLTLYVPHTKLAPHTHYIWTLLNGKGKPPATITKYRGVPLSFWTWKNHSLV